MTTITIRNSKFSIWFVLWVAFLLVALAIGVVSVLAVLVEGLGITNLTNHLPWGLWITVDLSSIALGAGAFTLSAAVYIFGLKRYEAIARAAVFVGLLGYTSAMLALFVDIGRPDRFYHPLLYWNVHSVLWEITMCVVFYSTVLMMEVVPIIIESTPLYNRRILRWLAHTLHRIMPVAALAGMGLSLLHQSSLGATYGVLTARPLWYSPSAPVLFILSAIAGGVSFIIFLTLIASALTQKKLVPDDVLNGVVRFAGVAVAAYLYLKIWSWATTNYYSHLPAMQNDLELLNQNTPYSFTFWWFEILLGALVPAIIYFWPRLRRNRVVLMLGALAVVLGLVVYRWNMTLSGFVVPLDWSPGVADVFAINTYEPAAIEWGVALLIVAYGSLAFTLGVRFLKLYPHAEGETPHEHDHHAAAAPHTPGEAPSPAR